MSDNNNTTTEIPLGISVCLCGHVGDASFRLEFQGRGRPVQHAGILGHGPCEVEGCTCEKFTWKEHLKGEN